jgi:hypothetical protein
MAQHRQAPRQFKEEPGHDSVSCQIFLSCPSNTPPDHRRFRHGWVIRSSACTRAVVPRRVPNRWEDGGLISGQFARDKSISKGATTTTWVKSRHPCSRFRDFPCSTTPGRASQLFQKTACRCRILGRGGMRVGIAGALPVSPAARAPVTCDRGRCRDALRASALRWEVRCTTRDWA